MQNTRFVVDEKVKFVRTSSELNGRTGVVLNNWKFDSTDGMDFIIVGLDSPYKGVKAIQIIESCLEKI